MKKLIIVLLSILIVVSAIGLIKGFLLYEDNGKPLENKGNLSITVTGDIMFGRKMPSVLSLDSDPYRFVSNVTGASDILIVNFENPATNSGNVVKGDVPLKCSPIYVPLVKGANITVCALANNHVFDYGESGLNDTLSVLKNDDILYLGAGNNISDASKPVVINKNNRTVTILNYMDSSNFAEYSQEVMPVASENNSGYCAYSKSLMNKQVNESISNGSDYVIVFFHYGNEYSMSPNSAQINMSHESIDAGADIVLGAHAHVSQGVEMYHEKPIFYNLGNFIFDQRNPNTHRAYFVNIGLVNSSANVSVYPVNIINYLPHFMSPTEGRSFLSELNPQCSEMSIGDDGVGRISYNI